MGALRQFRDEFGPRRTEKYKGILKKVRNSRGKAAAKKLFKRVTNREFITSSKRYWERLGK